MLYELDDYFQLIIVLMTLPKPTLIEYLWYLFRGVLSSVLHPNWQCPPDSFLKSTHIYVYCIDTYICMYFEIISLFIVIFHLANISGATDAGVERGWAPVARTPHALGADNLSLLGAVRKQLTANFGGPQLVMDDRIDHLLAVLVNKPLALVRDCSREITAHELNNPLNLKICFILDECDLQGNWQLLVNGHRCGQITSDLRHLLNAEMLHDSLQQASF